MLENDQLVIGRGAVSPTNCLDQSVQIAGGSTQLVNPWRKVLDEPLLSDRVGALFNHYHDDLRDETCSPDGARGYRHPRLEGVHIVCINTMNSTPLSHEVAVIWAHVIISEICKAM